MGYIITALVLLACSLQVMLLTNSDNIIAQTINTAIIFYYVIVLVKPENHLRGPLTTKQLKKSKDVRMALTNVPWALLLTSVLCATLTHFLPSSAHWLSWALGQISLTSFAGYLIISLSVVLYWAFIFLVAAWDLITHLTTRTSSSTL